MIRYEKRFWALAAGLSGLAGYVDAVGFLKLGGFFVSFMSGNSTRLAVGLASNANAAMLAGSLIATFVFGVVVGSVVSAQAKHRRKPAALALVSVLLGAAATIDAMGGGRWAAIMMAIAMGAENVVFQRDGEVSIGVTYMTGTLVKFGQHLASALLGKSRWGWLPYGILWSSLVCGAVIGASVHIAFGSAAIWTGAVFALLLTIWAAAITRNQLSPGDISI